MKSIPLIALLAILLASSYFMGRFDGKHSADHWYAEHWRPVQSTPSLIQMQSLEGGQNAASCFEYAGLHANGVTMIPAVMLPSGITQDTFAFAMRNGDTLVCIEAKDRK